jgi:tetratricopeptide (TPR) repeat protein
MLPAGSLVDASGFPTLALPRRSLGGTLLPRSLQRAGLAAAALLPLACGAPRDDAGAQTAFSAAALAEARNSAGVSIDARMQAVSLLGAPLFTPVVPEDQRAVLEQRLAAASAAAAAAPNDEMAAVWLGRRLSALNRFDEALEVYTCALAQHPDSYRLLRFRGHRYITLRRFDLAERDLARAAELVRGLADEDEPNGDPDPSASYPSSVQHQIHYHLALARYLRGDFARAATAWNDCLRHAGDSPDALCGATNWYCATLLRMRRPADAARLLAAIRADLPVREAGGYLRLCLLYKGELEPGLLLPAGEKNPVQLATLSYGLGNYWLVHGDPERARDVFRTTTEFACWQAFGRIAAEAELARQ